MHLGLQLKEQHSSSTESTTSLSNRELTVMTKTTSQDQSPSSDSIQDEGKKIRHDMNQPPPTLFLCNSEMSINASQTNEISQPMTQFSYAYSDPYLNGLFAAYGPHTMIQPQMIGPASGRVPLPADLPEDGPIYVNAKQYHGILRRRQTRAKMEAQNKLVKTRRPYLHESRHKHALNRVRGTGGRFLSTKNSESRGGSSMISQNSQDSSYQYSQQGNMLGPTRYDTNEGGNDGDAIYQQEDGRYSTNIPSHMLYSGNHRHYASIVR